jgi:hypothetical protein
MTPIRILTPQFMKIHFNTILPSWSMSFKWSILARCSVEMLNSYMSARVFVRA